MNKWETIKFKNFIKLNRGFDLPNDKMELGNFPVVASTNIKGYHNKYKIEPPCVVTGRSGSLGTVQYVTEKCTPLNTTLYVKDFKGNNPKFVYYYLKTMHLEQFNSGAGVPTLNQNHLHSYGVKVPDLPTQKRIADVLSAYDDLIENNNKRIALLEKAAQGLYKEWFVRFRFPGHEKAKFVNGLPEGWSCVKLGEYANISTGKCNREDAEDEGIYPLFDRSQEIKKSNVWIKDCEAIIVPGEGTSFIPRYFQGKFNLHQRCYCVEPKLSKIGKFLYQILMLNRIYFLYVATGATVPSLRQNNFTSMKILMPEISLVNKFDDVVSSFMNEINSLNERNKNLIKQRDLLLPRLMSGKLEV